MKFFDIVGKKGLASATYVQSEFIPTGWFYEAETRGDIEAITYYDEDEVSNLNVKTEKGIVEANIGDIVLCYKETGELEVIQK